VKSFTERMIGAARLDTSVYEEVETDRAATTQAMGVVLLSSVATGLGAGGVDGFVIQAAVALAGWVIWAALTYVIGAHLLPEPQTRASVPELMRTLGFAQTPGILRVFIGIPILGAVVLLVVSIWMLVATVIAVRQALDYSSTMRALGVCVIGWIVSAIPIVVAMMTGAVE
jgi:hypothetical protein